MPFIEFLLSTYTNAAACGGNHVRVGTPISQSESHLGPLSVFLLSFILGLVPPLTGLSPNPFPEGLSCPVAILTVNSDSHHWVSRIPKMDYYLPMHTICPACENSRSRHIVCTSTLFDLLLLLLYPSNSIGRPTRHRIIFQDEETVWVKTLDSDSYDRSEYMLSSRNVDPVFRARPDDSTV